MIVKNDIVAVTLANGVRMVNLQVKKVPKKNEMYWTLEGVDGQTFVIGPSFIAITKEP